MGDATHDATIGFLAKHLGALRLLAFREDDRNNRRLLFDSDCVVGELQTDGLPSCRTQSDSKLLAEMIFGSTPTVCNGESIKIHQFRNPMRLMFTKIFPAHQLASPGISSLQREMVQRRFSADPEFIARQRSGGEISNIAVLKSSHSDIPQRLLSSDGSRRSSESSEDCEILPALHRLRRQRIGVAVLFTVGEESQSEEEPRVSRRVRFLCSQSPTIFASVKDELQDVVLTAYCARTSVTEIMKRAWRRFLICMKTMCESTCRAHHSLKYFKLAWSSNPVLNDSPIDRFIGTLSSLGTKFDTKQTNFFLSTLITSVLGMERNYETNRLSKKITEIRIKCNDGRLMAQLLDVIGYFLTFIIEDFDRVSVKSVPIPLMRSLSSRTTSRTTGALASLWSMVRSRRSVRESSIGEKSSNASPSSRRASNGLLSPSPSSPLSARAVPVILVKENGLDEENEEQMTAMDENTVSVSSSVNSSASTANLLSSAGGSADDDELLSNMFDDIEEKPLSAIPVLNDFSRHTDYALEPLCGDLEANHAFGSDETTSGRPLDVLISFCEFATSASEVTQDALIVDATSWKVYQTSIVDLASQATDDTWSVCFPSALITEMLENLRMLSAQDFDSNFCFMYLEDGIKDLFSKAEALTRLLRDNSDKCELRPEFCTKVMRCDMPDLSFLLK